jgi:2-polyprenyl-3-methyl-5-hydroxy-6-metoxy-1,4-benzoquinol methylase
MENYYPGSYNFFKEEVCAYIDEQYPNGTVLDMGAGSGKWGLLLGDTHPVDGIEVNLQTIAFCGLPEIYRTCYHGKAENLKFDWYDVIVMGDLLEHYTVEGAQRLIEYCYPRCGELVIAVPYLYEQGAIHGNEYEIHRQPDLTHELFMERYPGFRLLYGNELYGYYVKG